MRALWLCNYDGNRRCQISTLSEEWQAVRERDQTLGVVKVHLI